MKNVLKCVLGMFSECSCSWNVLFQEMKKLSNKLDLEPFTDQQLRQLQEKLNLLDENVRLELLMTIKKKNPSAIIEEVSFIFSTE